MFTYNRRNVLNDLYQEVRNKALRGLKESLRAYIGENIEVIRYCEELGTVPFTLTGIITEATINDDFSVVFTVEYHCPSTGKVKLTQEPLVPPKNNC